MKKRITTAIVIAAMSLSIMACGGGGSAETKAPETQATTETIAETEPAATETEAPATEAAVEDDGVIKFDGVTHSVEYIKHETGTDWEGNPCLLYYYTFTNTGEENANAAVTAYIQCFQNGIECEQTFLEEAFEESDNTIKDIQPGASIEVCNIYLLEDNSEVTLEASDWTSFDNAKDVQKITLE